jgi:hypothetical protein
MAGAPKCTTDEIRQEIAKLEGSGLKCAAAYLRAELKRREGSATNAGRPIKGDDEQRKKWRESKRAYRRKKAAETPETPVKDESDWGA